MITYGAIKSGEAAVPVAVTPIAKEIGKLPALVEAAVRQLAQAKTAAEVLDAKDRASLIYDAAKRAARIAEAKGAHDELVAEAHRAQANALKIEAGAKERLADEYDAAQERGEVAKGGRPKSVSEVNGNPATVEDIGLTRKDVFKARRLRDAEIARPGIVSETVEKALAAKVEPTRALVNAAVAEALGEQKPAQKSRNIREELVALWCEADHEDRHGFIAYLRTIGFRIEVSTGGDDVDRSAERASSAVEVGATNSPDGAKEAEEIHLTGRGTRERGEHGANRRNGGAVERRISEGSPVGEAEDASVTSSGGEHPAINPVANVGEGANGAIAAASVDPASRDVDGADRQQPATFGITGEADRDAGNTPTCALTPRDVFAVGTNSQSVASTAEAVTDKPQAPRPSVTANNSSPANSAVADGQLGIPSSDALAAGQGESLRISAKSEQAVSQFNNPRCQKPETCHLVHSRNECFDCTMAWPKRPKDEQIRLWAEAMQAARAA